MVEALDGTGVHQVHGGSGDPSPFTAYGTLQGLMAALQVKFGNEEVGPVRWQIVMLAVVQGITEFLPISSTGHLIVASSLLNFTGPMVKGFEVAIQTGERRAGDYLLEPILRHLRKAMRDE